MVPVETTLWIELDISGLSDCPPDVDFDPAKASCLGVEEQTGTRWLQSIAACRGEHQNDDFTEMIQALIDLISNRFFSLYLNHRADNGAGIALRIELTEKSGR